MKKVIKLNESHIQKIIAETVKRILNEEGSGLPYYTHQYDRSRESEYSDFDNFIAKLAPYYSILDKDIVKDPIYSNKGLKDNMRSARAAEKMKNMLNQYLGGEYLEVDRGGHEFLLGAVSRMDSWAGMDNWRNWMDADECYNYCLVAENGVPEDKRDELFCIIDSLQKGILPDTKMQADAMERKKEHNSEIERRRNFYGDKAKDMSDDDIMRLPKPAEESPGEPNKIKLSDYDMRPRFGNKK
jgi:hypothetical protein